MLPVILATLGAGMLLGASGKKADEREAIARILERPNYRVVVTRKSGATETLIGSLIGVWTGALERESQLRSDPNPVTKMVLYASDNSVIRTWPTGAPVQGLAWI